MSFPPRVLTADEAAALIPDEGLIVNCCRLPPGLGCPDAVLAAIGRRFEKSGHPTALTSLHPIAAGDMWGVKGIEPPCQSRAFWRASLPAPIPSGPIDPQSRRTIWKMITGKRDSSLQHS